MGHITFDTAADTAQGTHDTPHGTHYIVIQQLIQLKVHHDTPHGTHYIVIQQLIQLKVHHDTPHGTHYILIQQLIQLKVHMIYIDVAAHPAHETCCFSYRSVMLHKFVLFVSMFCYKIV